MKRAGFTLVEWVLLVTIVVVLIAILWPMVRGAYDRVQGLAPVPTAVSTTLHG